MSVERIASRYAKTLVELGEEGGKLDRIKEDIASFIEVCTNRDFQLLLKSPIVHTDKKQGVFTGLFDGKYDPLTISFFDIILRKGREEFLPEIAEQFMKQYRAMRKIAAVSLTTAAQLTGNQEEAIKAKIVAASEAVDSVDLHAEVDADIIGGFVLEFDNKLYDASVAHQLHEARKLFS